MDGNRVKEGRVSRRNPITFPGCHRSPDQLSTTQDQNKTEHTNAVTITRAYASQSSCLKYASCNALATLLPIRSLLSNIPSPLVFAVVISCRVVDSLRHQSVGLYCSVRPSVGSTVAPASAVLQVRCNPCTCLSFSISLF